MVIAPPTEVLPVSGAARPTLPAALMGKVIEAKLTLALADGLFRFSSPEGEIDLPLPRNLPPGTQVRIAPQPDGSFQVTVLNDENLPATARPLPSSSPQAPPTPPLTTVVHPRHPVPLPQGQEIIARVTGNPEPGLVRVATPQGEVDLPLPRPVPLGTPLRITPEPQGAVRVSVPEIPARAQAPADTAAQKPVVHPTVFTSKPETVPVNIPLGRVVEAKVLPSAQQGVVRFVSPEGEFQLPLPKEFPPGTQARVVAQPNGSVVVTMRPEVPQQPGMQAAPISAATIAASPAMRAVTLPPGPSIPVLPAGQVIEATISPQPPRVDGMVRVATPLGEFELPLPQHQALPPGTPVRIAPQPNGGLTFVPMSDGPDAAVPLPLTNPQASTPAEAVRQTVRSAVLKQDGLANVFADLETLPLRTDAPQAVRRAAETLLGQRVSLEDVVKPDQLARAIAGSGIFAERTLSSLPPLQSAPPDLKLALFVLRAALGNWARTDNLPLTSSVLSARPETVPPPPTGTSAPAAQAPAEPSHMKNGQLSMHGLSAEEFVPHVARDIDAALARVNLHQIASLPDDRSGAQRTDAPDARWSAEIPVNIDGRTAVFGFVIERDGRQQQMEKEKRRWRFRAALDLPDTGAIEADVRLMGTHVSAGIVAESEKTVALLEAALPLLRDGLTAQGFDVEVLSVRKGKGTPPPAPPGYFMDRRT